MSYLDELLGEGETVLFVSHRHWFIFFARILAELILLILLAAVASAAYRYWQPNGRYVAIGAGIVAVIVLLSLLSDYLRWNNERYVVTTRRVLQVKGVINKMVLDSSLEKINDIELQQTFFGRIFDYGSIEILTGSEEAVNRMDRIAHPLDFKRAMLNARARYDGVLRQAPLPAAAEPGMDLQKMLEQLATLHSRGILTDAEFEQKKRDILARI
jgi:uncharacterized membrane protein YdbT with pleckstrin-like domain